MTSYSSEASNINANCAICGFHGVDIRLKGCCCMLHARCLPVTSIVREKGLANHEKQPVAPGECLCPACNMSPVTSVQVLPLNIADLDKVVALRKKLSKDMASKSAFSDNTEKELAEAQAEASYLLLSHGNSTAALCTDNEYQRTGRWTDDEMAYTNFLIEAFDDGKLPLEHGLKLNDFLSDVLLCKSSRLTKKMKNARLSTRSYDIRFPVPEVDVQMLSSLEEKFVKSISSEPSRMEVQFNIAKHWRSQLSNLCLQINSSLLDNSAWIKSLEQIEHRAIEAEEHIRRARRKRVGVSIRRDSQGGQEFPSEAAFEGPGKRAKIEERQDFVSMDAGSTSLSQNNNNNNNGGFEQAQEMAEPIPSAQKLVKSVSSEDFGKIFNENAEDAGLPSTSMRARQNSGAFLEEIVEYVESIKIPFEHVDVWVPSYTTSSSGDDVMRLFYAGHVTKSSLCNDAFCRITEFGEYSKNFSFAAGDDLPGRVFANNKPHWVRKLNEADSGTYERSDGAKMYGIKTAFGFPMQTAVVDSIIVCMYSTVDVPENPFTVHKCQTDLSKLCPEPKWKLVVEIGPGAMTVAPSRRIPANEETYLTSSDSSNGGQSRRSLDEEALVDHCIASLLGEHMPISDNKATREAGGAHQLVPYFMSLRLLLLSPHSRRTNEEKRCIDLLRKSYSQYSRDESRSNQDLAFLVVKDWQYLQSKQGISTTSSAPVESEQGNIVFKQYRGNTDLSQNAAGFNRVATSSEAEDSARSAC